MNLFPWHYQPWQQFLEYKKKQRLPHALLLQGLAGLGKRKFAHAMAHLLLCKANGDAEKPCERCTDCQLFKMNSHPDLISIEPEKPGQPIKVEQVRDLIHEVNQTSLKSGYRVVIIYPANHLNRNAANAFLKTLEEPAPNTVMILISDQGKTLPVTVLSRCQKIDFKTPSTQEALDWLGSDDDQTRLLLNLAENSPLKAKEWAESEFLSLRERFYEGLALLEKNKIAALTLAAEWQSQDLEMICNFLISGLRDLLRFNLAGENKLCHNACSLSTEACFRLFDRLQEIRRYEINGFNLNKQLLLEEFFIQWSQECG